MIISFLFLLSGIAWVPLWLVINVILGADPKWLRWWGNRVDNLPDAVKEWLHCHRLPFGYQLNISVIMKNRKPKTWDIIRKWGYYKNCDPEDLSAISEQNKNG